MIWSWTVLASRDSRLKSSAQRRWLIWVLESSWQLGKSRSCEWSATKLLNRSGERGWPCSVPFAITNLLLRWPVNLIWANEFEYTYFLRRHKNYLLPQFWLLWRRGLGDRPSRMLSWSRQRLRKQVFSIFYILKQWFSLLECDHMSELFWWNQVGLEDQDS